MRISPAGIALICRFESCRLEAYPDPGPAGWTRPTIGWGHTGPDVHQGDVIDQPRADALLAGDVAAFARAVSSAVSVPLTQTEFDPLVSFAYNCVGWQASSLFRFVNLGEFDLAAAEFPKWVHATGGVVEPGLVIRRAAEQAMFLA